MLLVFTKFKNIAFSGNGGNIKIKKNSQIFVLHNFAKSLKSYISWEKNPMTLNFFYSNTFYKLLKGPKIILNNARLSSFLFFYFLLFFFIYFFIFIYFFFFSKKANFLFFFIFFTPIFFFYYFFHQMFIIFIKISPAAR